jgi:hypothetical protein
MVHQWSYSTEDDIWVVSHNALRRMINDLCLAIDVIGTKAHAGRLVVWHLQYLKTYWKVFEQAYDEYNIHKEIILLPWIAEKIDLPDTLTLQSKNVESMMQECKELVVALDMNTDDVLKNVQHSSEKLHAFCSCLCEYFKNQEQQTIETIHKCYAETDVKPMIQKFKQELKPASYGWLLYGFTDRSRKHCWLNQVLRASHFQKYFVIFPSLKHFTNTTHKMFVDLVTSY